MFFILVFLASTPTMGGVIDDYNTPCSNNEFSCADGGCVSLELLCDGSRQCADGSDEAACDFGSANLLYDSILRRPKRQAACRKFEWACKDGTCISFDGKCDGMLDCPDGSDESHALCRNTKCQPNWFRCTYGACADGTAPCNGVQECADNSDELLPRCRNSTDEQRGQFRCEDGSSISATSLCDGVPDCPDESDEKVRACADKTCPSYLFQCAYGACVDQGADCNGKSECADGSDEAEDLCSDRIFSGGSGGTTPSPPSASGRCKLPPYPEHGSYKVDRKPGARPGDSYANVVLTISCLPEYMPTSVDSIHCNDGLWSIPLEKFPKCTRYCTLKDEPSVNYTCLLSGNSQGIRQCEPQEPSGTVVNVTCNTPNYYSATSLPRMRCLDGNWDKTPVCIPECGRLIPEGEILIINGTSAKRGEVSWHAGIYTKNYVPYFQVCGGSIISTTAVISAAHCFWDDLVKLQPPELYAVAVGKLYRPWDEEKDLDAQHFDVSKIHVPQQFQGARQNFQADIAIVILSTAIVYQTYVRPVCIDFDYEFDQRQLAPGNKGKVAGWGLTAENGKGSTVLKVTELPVVDIDECNAAAAEGAAAFVEYITFDKICAGYLSNRTSVCKGDSGGGLAFPDRQRGIIRYYLRGVVSTAPRDENSCSSNTFTTFTHIQKHESFIRPYIP